MAQVPSSVRRERRALFDLENSKRTGWDEAGERLLAGRADDVVRQRRLLKQNVWKEVVSGNVAGVKQIIDAKTDLGSMRGVFGETVLHICLLFQNTKVEDHRQIAQMILESSAADRDIANICYTKEPYVGEAPLHLAIINNDKHVVELLLRHKADLQVS